MFTNTYQHGVSGVSFYDAVLEDDNGSYDGSMSKVTMNLGTVYGKTTANYRLIFRLDISNIPKSAIITSAVLTVTTTAFAGLGTVYVLAAEGSEGGWVDTGSPTTNPTWQKKTNLVNWGSLGGSMEDVIVNAGEMLSSGATLDYDITRIASRALRYSAGDLNFLLKGSSEGAATKTITIHSGDASSSSNRPLLTIQYVIGSGTGSKLRLAHLMRKKKFNKWK